MPVIGVVLAGGQSSRMGQDKALLVWQGQTLLERSAALLAELCDEVWLSGRSDPRWPGVPDAYPERGPVGAIHSITGHSITGHSLTGHSITGRAPESVTLLILPVDLPRLTAEPLRALLADPAPVAHFIDHPLPAKLHVSRDLFQAAETLLTTPNARCSVQALWQACGAHALACPEPWLAELANANTPHAWQALLQQEGVSR